MSANIENIAFTNEKPWHNLGVEVSGNLSAHEMMVASKTDWEVETLPMFTTRDGVNIQVPKSAALIRKSDNSVLDVVGDDWLPNQNATAFEFFHDFVEAGNMTMETAGSLRGGRYVWALAKVNAGFELFNGDEVKAYLLFTNPHMYGKSIDVRFTPTRVVCNNTLTLALQGLGNAFKSNHRVVFDAEKAKKAVGLVHAKMELYKEAAEFLGSKLYTEETVADFFEEVFPVQSVSDKAKKKTSKNAQLATLALTHQPGLEFAPGSWWQAFNAVTYVTDHLMGRDDENRVEGIWYGPVKDKKTMAFNLAMEMAKKA